MGRAACRVNIFFVSYIPISFHLMDTESKFATCDPSKAHILVSTPVQASSTTWVKTAPRLQQACDFLCAPEPGVYKWGEWGALPNRSPRIRSQIRNYFLSN